MWRGSTRFGVVFFEDDHDIELGRRIIQPPERIDQTRQHRGLAVERHEQRVVRQLPVGERRCRAVELAPGRVDCHLGRWAGPQTVAQRPHVGVRRHQPLAQEDLLRCNPKRGRTLDGGRDLGGEQACPHEEAIGIGRPSRWGVGQRRRSHRRRSRLVRDGWPAIVRCRARAAVRRVSLAFSGFI